MLYLKESARNVAVCMALIVPLFACCLILFCLYADARSRSLHWNMHMSVCVLRTELNILGCARSLIVRSDWKAVEAVDQAQRHVNKQFTFRRQQVQSNAR